MVPVPVCAVLPSQGAAAEGWWTDRNWCVSLSDLCDVECSQAIKLSSQGIAADVLVDGQKLVGPYLSFSLSVTEVGRTGVVLELNILSADHLVNS